jgi:SpoVK/Ycf46/Vps4 family AAA+-type ATPase
MLAQALAAEARAYFVPLALADVLKSNVGESEQLIADVFRRARACAPCIVFLDDVQSLLSKQDDSPHLSKVRAQLFFELDRLQTRVSHASAAAVAISLQSVSSPPSSSSVSPPPPPLLSLDAGVVVLAATNRPDLIDPALVLRGGRFGEAIHVPLPTPAERALILASFRASTPWSSSVDVAAIAQRAAGFSGADLRRLCSQAAMHALSRGTLDAVCVEMADFEAALQAE